MSYLISYFLSNAYAFYVMFYFILYYILYYIVSNISYFYIHFYHIFYFLFYPIYLNKLIIIVYYVYFIYKLNFTELTEPAITREERLLLFLFDEILPIELPLSSELLMLSRLISTLSNTSSLGGLLPDFNFFATSAISYKG